jgi:hypothetical protein
VLVRRAGEVMMVGWQAGYVPLQERKLSKSDMQPGMSCGDG